MLLGRDESLSSFLILKYTDISTNYVHLLLKATRLMTRETWDARLNGIEASSFFETKYLFGLSKQRKFKAFYFTSTHDSLAFIDRHSVRLKVKLPQFFPKFPRQPNSGVDNFSWISNYPSIRWELLLLFRAGLAMMGKPCVECAAFSSTFPTHWGPTSSQGRLPAT